MATDGCDDERFSALEKRAESALYKDYREAGEALKQIRDEEQACWRPLHGSWERYCRERWGISRQHACYLIQGAEVARDVSSRDDAPRLPLRHSTLLYRFKQPAVRRELAALIAPMTFREATRYVVDATTKSSGDTGRQTVRGSDQPTVLVDLEVLLTSCRRLDLGAVSRAISFLDKRRRNALLRDLDNAASHLAALRAIAGGQRT